MFFYIIYHMPLWMPMIIILLAVIIWPLVMYKLCKKSSFFLKLINLMMTVIAVLGIFGATVLNRSHYNNEIILIPFYSFVEARIQPEMYRTMLMNVFLFFPLGLCLPYAISFSGKKNIAFTVLIGFLLSLCIEIFQLVFSCGRCEADDVICNTVGTVIGSVSYFIYLLKQENSSV